MPEFPADRNQVVLPPINRDLVAAMNRRLLARHGATMGYEAIAEEFGITPNAARLRQCRIGDLPDPIPHMKANRWPTPVIAAWLCHLTDTQTEPVSAYPKNRQARANHRRLGRPRLRQHVHTAEGQ